MAYSGKYKVKNPSKYQGDPTSITYRSSWEAKFMQYLDEHPEIITWSSEEKTIIYRSPVDGKLHRYFPDFWIKKMVDGVAECAIIEIKPRKQTLPPQNKPSRITNKYLTEVTTYLTNKAKFEAAQHYCTERNWKFIVLTENELFKTQ